MGNPQCPDCLELIAYIERLEGRLKELEERLSKNSRNSSKPPSSDGLRKPEPKSLRKKSGRNPGGQEGHGGETLKMAAEPDEVVVHGASHCERCGHSLDGAAAEVERRQVFDLPPMRLKVTEHQAETRNCPACGHANRASFPEDVAAPVQYGQHIRSIAVYLLEYQLLPYDRTSELMADLFSASMSTGTLANMVGECSEEIAPATERIKEIIRGSAVAHFDESGGSVDGKLKWFHVASTETATHYDLHAKRGTEAMDEIGILPGFQGRAVHDFWKPYLGYECEHGLCNAHLLRELIFVHEEMEQRWAGEMIGHLLKIKDAVDEARAKAGRLSKKELRRFDRRYRRILKMGRAENPVARREPGERKRGRPKKSKAANLLERFEGYRKDILAFMYDFRVPFDNNLPERDIRMLKVKMKISGAFRSEEGGKAFCRIRGYISTARKNAVNAIDAIRSAFAGRPFIPLPAPCT